MDEIVSSADIAELVSAGAGDMFTSLVFLYDHITSSASFKGVVLL